MKRFVLVFLTACLLLWLVPTDSQAQWGKTPPRWFANIYTEQVYTTNGAVLPQTANDTLFTIVGMFEILEIVGEVETIIAGGANNTKLIIDNGTTATDICANLDIDGDVVGSFMTITGTIVDAMVNNALKVPIAGAQAGAIRTPPGTSYLMIYCAAGAGTGKIIWSLRGKALQQGVTITPHNE